MAKQIINVGTSANSRTGDNLRTAFIKINDNFDEVYTIIEQGVAGIEGPEGPVGPVGPRGLRGVKGDTGANGASAYEIAVQNGFVGTEQEWLNSLTGISAPAATIIAGSVFITDINPVSIDDNVGNKVFSNNGKILESCISDTDNIKVSVLAKPGFDYEPIITVNGVEVILIEQLNGTFSGDVFINLNGSTTVTAVHSEGPTDTCIVNKEYKPIILSARFINGYPPGQSEVKAVDTFDFAVMTNVNITSIEVFDYGAFEADIFNISPTMSYTFTGNVANRGTTTRDYGAKIRVVTASGSKSDYFYTDSFGVNDGVSTIKLNNVYPSIIFNSVTYPGTQQALKNNESATISLSISNGDQATFTSPNNQLSILAPTILSNTKTVSRIGGTYNVTTPNIQVFVTRTANGATNSAQSIVNIANVACTVSIGEQYSRLRLGGDYTITLTSNQTLLKAPFLGIGTEGSFLGSGFTGSNKNWTRTISITDDCMPGTYTWNGVSATNLAGIVTTTITGDNSYTIGGFTERTITLNAYENEALLPLPITDYNKLIITWEIKNLPNKRPVGTTIVPDPNSWCAHTLNTNPSIIRILDIAATLASSSPTIIFVEETT